MPMFTVQRKVGTEVKTYVVRARNSATANRIADDLAARDRKEVASR